jgi:hypothetical protein
LIRSRRQASSEEQAVVFVEIGQLSAKFCSEIADFFFHGGKLPRQPGVDKKIKSDRLKRDSSLGTGAAGVLARGQSGFVGKM